MSTSNLYRVLFESASDAILLLYKGRLMDCNASALTLFGSDRQAMLGQPLLKFLPAAQPDGYESAQALQDSIAAALEGESQHVEWQYQRADGSVFQAAGILHQAAIDDETLMLQVPQVHTYNNNHSDNGTATLRDSELDRFFLLSSGMLCIAGVDGYFKRVNPAWTQQLGYTEAELLARPYLDFVHPDDHDTFIAQIGRLAAEEGLETVTFESRCRSKDGLYKWLLWNFTPAEREGLLYCTASDITRQKQIENNPQNLTGPNRREGWQETVQAQTAQGYLFDQTGVHPVTPEVLGLPYSSHTEEVPPASEVGKTPIMAPLAIGGEVIGRLGVHDDPDQPLSDDDQDLLDAIATQVAGALERARLFNESQQRAVELQVVATESDRLRQETEDRLQELRSLQRLTSREGWQEYQDTQVQEMQGYLFDQTAVRPMAADELDAYQYGDTLQESMSGAGPDHIAVTAPIAVSGEVIGTLGIQDDPGRPLSGDDRDLLQSISVQVAGALERARLFVQTRRRASELETMATESDRLRQETEDRLQELRSLQRLTSREGWQEYQAAQMQAAQGYLFDQTAVRPMAADELDVLQESMPEAEAGQTAITAPIAVSGEVIGTLGIQGSPGQPLSSDDRELLESISVQVAGALERARLFVQAQRRAAELQTVAQVSAVAATTLEVEQLLQDVVNLTRDSFGLYHAHVYLLDEDNDMLVLTAGAGEVGQQMVSEGYAIPLNHKHSVVVRAADIREGVISNDVRSDPEFSPHPLLPDTRAEMAIPLVVGAQVIGVLDVQSERTNRFTEEDLRIQTTLASQVAIALRNAELYAEQIHTVDRLRELGQLKSSFLANMSHELRTPLNSILGFTDVLLEELDGPLTDLMRTDLKVVYKNGQHLLSLINDVLDMAKIEAGGMTLTYEWFDLLGILTEVVDTVTPMARAKDIELKIKSDILTPVELDGDQIRLRQVIINIVNNAVKFTDQGGVYLYASTLVNEGKVQIKIVDTGLGVPADKQDVIFEEFSQVDTSSTRKTGGTGLGLPITKHLVDMHGGKLWVESTGISGEGSTFIIELPIEHVPEEKEPVAE